MGAPLGSPIGKWKLGIKRVVAKNVGGSEPALPGAAETPREPWSMLGAGLASAVPAPSGGGKAVEAAAVAETASTV